MTDLTEQFNNDELDDEKLYYFRQKMSEEIEVGSPFALNMVRATDGTYLDWFLIDKVLAPVPIFEEYQQLKEYERIVTSYNMKPIDYDIACETVNKLLDKKKVLKEENAQLKELLRECGNSLEEQSNVRKLYESDVEYRDRYNNKMDLLIRLDEVLK